MNLKEVKLKPLNEGSQILVFDESLKFLESCNTLVEIKSDNPLGELYFLDGLDTIFGDLAEDESYVLQCVGVSFFGKESCYDFHIIHKKEDGKSRLVICVYDFNEQYAKLLDLQQERNVTAIKESELQRKFLEVEKEKEVIERLYRDSAIDTPREFVFIRTDQMWVNVDLNSIFYFEAYGDYIKVHTDSKVYIIHSTMKKLEDKLSSKDYARIHRSYIVRIDKIENIEVGNLQMNDKILPVGNSYRKDLVDKLDQL